MKNGSQGSAFFHTLVIMGGSLAGCGGQAQDGSKGDGDAANSGGSPSGDPRGDGDGDVPIGSGGGAGVGTGGSFEGGDGDIIIVSGGTSSTGGNYMGGAHGLGCPPEQWACSGIPYDCSWDEHEILQNCVCDESRPVSQDDCPAGTALTCMEGVEYDADFNGEMQPFGCECLPQEETCSDQCGPMVDYPGDCWEPTADFSGYICGCEIPVLR